jgi:hypothetical protein
MLADGSDPMLLHDADGLTVRGHLQLGVNLVSERELFWNFAATVAPEVDYDPGTDWLEGYVEPGLSFEKVLRGSKTLFGKASFVASYTLGTDAYDTGDTGRVTLEEAFLGLRGSGGPGLSYEIVGCVLPISASMTSLSSTTG